MIAAILNKPRSIEIIRTTAPEPGENEVKVRVEGCGICASSIPLWEGREWFQYPQSPGSPGHEAWGVIEKAGDNVRGFRTGDRVAFLSGHSYAEFDVAHANSIIKLPDALSGQPFPAEPLGCAMNIFSRCDITKEDTVAVIGTGFLGTLLIQLAKNAGAKVIAISRRKSSLEFAEKFGADEIISWTDSWQVAHAVAEITNDKLCSRVIEATGKQQALDVAIEIIAERGRLIVAGYHQDGLRKVDFQKWNWKGIDVINAHERDPSVYLEGMKKAVDAVVNGVLKPSELYSENLPISELARGFEYTIERPAGFMKALIHL